MDGTPDSELLDRYLRAADEDAFAEIVQRHCSLVWATAHRVSRDSEAARDVTQSVFCALARKAGRLPAGAVVAGWLHRTAYLEALKQVRNESRRAQRERTAMNERDADATSVEIERAAAALEPLLDEALSELGDDDRHAVVLRYLSGRSLAEVGVDLGTSEDAAQKRVRRAVERLREWFRRRGVSAGEGVVVGALGLVGAQAAPAGLAASVVGAALAGGGAAATLSGVILMKSNVVLGTVAALAVASLVWQQVRLNRLGRENAELARRAAAAAVAPAPMVTTVPADDSRLQEDHAELLRLRGEVARLRLLAVEPGLRFVEAAESRARQAEAQAQAIRDEVAFRQRREQLITMGKNMGLAARIFSADHEGRMAASIEEMREALKNVGFDDEGRLDGGISIEDFEYLSMRQAADVEPHHHAIFRERRARQIPKAVLKPEDVVDGSLFATPLGNGWEQIVVMADGSVETRSSGTGVFDDYDFTRLKGATVLKGTSPARMANPASQ